MTGGDGGGNSPWTILFTTNLPDKPSNPNVPPMKDRCRRKKRRDDANNGHDVGI